MANASSETGIAKELDQGRNQVGDHPSWFTGDWGVSHDVGFSVSELEQSNLDSAGWSCESLQEGWVQEPNPLSWIKVKSLPKVKMWRWLEDFILLSCWVVDYFNDEGINYSLCYRLSLKCSGQVAIMLHHWEHFMDREMRTEHKSWALLPLCSHSDWGHAHLLCGGFRPGFYPRLGFYISDS